jgi:DNA primase catalytic subunit
VNYSEVIVRIANDILSKDRPNTLFEQAFFDLRIKMKDLKHDAAEKILKRLEKTLKEDLISKKVDVKDLDMKLGAFRGSNFITSSKLHVIMRSEEDAQRLAKYLQETFSPKFKFKKLEDGIAEFNIR